MFRTIDELTNNGVTDVVAEVVAQAATDKTVMNNLDNDTAFKSKHASRWEELFGKLVKHTLEGDMYTASKIFVATIVKPATQLSELRNELIDRGIDMASCVKKQMEVFDDQVDEIGAISQHDF